MNAIDLFSGAGGLSLGLEQAEQEGRFGFTSFPVMTSAYLG